MKPLGKGNNGSYEGNPSAHLILPHRLFDIPMKLYIMGKKEETD